METIRSSETSVHTRSTRRHIPENGILYSHRRENLKSYKLIELLPSQWLDTGDFVSRTLSINFNSPWKVEREIFGESPSLFTVTNILLRLGITVLKKKMHTPFTNGDCVKLSRFSLNRFAFGVTLE
jgi:hypothetical protein